MKNYLISVLICSLATVGVLANGIRSPFAKKPQAVIPLAPPKVKKTKSIQSKSAIKIDEVAPQCIKEIEPKYKLQGIIGDYVVINNTILTKGEEIGKFIVGDIFAKTVVLLGKDVNKTIKIDDGL